MVETVLVAVPRTGAAARMFHLGPGERLCFGRGSEDVAVDLILSDPAVARLAGEIVATGDHWSLSNYSRQHTYVVENPEGGGEFVKVSPGRLSAPVPFEMSRVVLPARDRTGTVLFQVFAPMHAHLALDIAQPVAGEPTLAAFPLDRTAKYFLVLVALCEPRLRDESPVDIPTDAGVATRLLELPGCGDLTGDAVAFHIDYLCRRKLRLGEPGGATAGQRRHHLVQVALRFDLVKEHDLDRLPPRHGSRLA